MPLGSRHAGMYGVHSERLAHLPLLKTKAFFTFCVTGPTISGTASRGASGLLSNVIFFLAFALRRRTLGRSSCALMPYSTATLEVLP